MIANYGKYAQFLCTPNKRHAFNKNQKVKRYEPGKEVHNRRKKYTEKVQITVSRQDPKGGKCVNYISLTKTYYSLEST